MISGKSIISVQSTVSCGDLNFSSHFTFVYDGPWLDAQHSQFLNFQSGQPGPTQLGLPPDHAHFRAGDYHERLVRRAAPGYRRSGDTSRYWYTEIWVGRGGAEGQGTDSTKMARYRDIDQVGRVRGGQTFHGFIKIYTLNKGFDEKVTALATSCP